MITCYVGVGSNIRPRESIRMAVRLLGARPELTVTGVSTFYWTDPIDSPGSPEFLNGVLRIRSESDVAELARWLAEIETAVGRERARPRNAPRPLDLDLLLCTPAGTGSLRPEHVDVTTRPFVAVPLLELAPELRLPLSGQPLAEIAAGFKTPWGRAETAFSQYLGQLARGFHECDCALDSRAESD